MSTGLGRHRLALAAGGGPAADALLIVAVEFDPEGGTRASWERDLRPG